MWRRIVLGQLAYAGPANASALLRPVVDLARQTVTISLVVADAEFDSERNHHHIRDQLGAESIIPAKRGKSTWQLHGIRAQMRANFPAARYRPRTLVERIFSAAKRKLSSRAPGRLPVTQHLQTLLLGLAYDLYPLRRAPSLPLGC
jgi:DDE family transposase